MQSFTDNEQFRITTRKRDRVRDEENRHTKQLQKNIAKFHAHNVQQSPDTKQRRR